MLPTDVGGSALGPRTFAAVIATLAEADASVAMVYLMHVCATATIAAARPGAAVAPTLKEIAAGRHLSTLAFSEAGSRSHFWAPVSRAQRNGAGVHLTRKEVVGDERRPRAELCRLGARARRRRIRPNSTLYLVPAEARGLSVAGPWDGLGTARQRFRADDPRGLRGRARASADRRRRRLSGDAEVVLPLFNLGSAAVALGLCRAAVAGTAAHLKSARFEHLGQSLGESLPTLRAQLATMQIDTDGLAARIDDLVDHLERPRDTTMLRVLEMQGGGRRNRDRRHLGGDAGLRRRGVLQAHGHRASVPRCACGRRHGADGRCSARVHRQVASWECRCSERESAAAFRNAGRD